MSDIEYSVITSDVIKSFDCICKGPEGRGGGGGRGYRFPQKCRHGPLEKQLDPKGGGAELISTKFKVFLKIYYMNIS